MVIVGNKSKKVPTVPKLAFPVPKVPKIKPIETTVDKKFIVDEPVSNDKPAKPDFRTELLARMGKRGGGETNENEDTNNPTNNMNNMNNMKNNQDLDNIFSQNIKNDNTQNTNIFTPTNNNTNQIKNVAQIQKTNTFGGSNHNTRKFNIKDDVFGSPPPILANIFPIFDFSLTVGG